MLLSKPRPKTSSVVLLKRGTPNPSQAHANTNRIQMILPVFFMGAFLFKVARGGGVNIRYVSGFVSGFVSSLCLKVCLGVCLGFFACISITFIGVRTRSYSVVQGRTLQYSIVFRSTKSYSTAQDRILQCDIKFCSAHLHSAVQGHILQYKIVLCSARSCSVVQDHMLLYKIACCSTTSYSAVQDRNF